MTPGSRHTAAKRTQCLLLARRVNFLVSMKKHTHIRVVKLLLIVIVIVIVMTDLWRNSNSNSNRLLKIPE